MYQSYEPAFYMNPYGHEAYMPIEWDQRQFGGGGPLGPPGPPPGIPGSPPPFGPPSSQPPFGPPGQGPSAGPPTSPPPSFVPMQTQQVQTLAIDPGSIRRCLFRYTYVWMRGRQQFWFYPIFLGRRSISGWRWTGFRWVFYGTSLRQIQSFTCV